MDKTYDPGTIETHWYEAWETGGYFSPSGHGMPYCIMLPPPNVTGSLHMGHAFQQTLMDILIRFHRMRGHNTLWQGGTDHAGIATQMVVERQLEQEGRRRLDLGRDAFVQAVWSWKETSGNTITRQSRRLGTSMDWSRERFTMDQGLSDAVIEVFVRLYEDGLIYRGSRLVNWDPVLHTAISDLEVISQEEDSYLWHMRYPYADGNGYVTVATTRPETMLGDTAVAVHPEDDRYRDLVGKYVELPLTGRTIPVIADDFVDPEFGTGCVKITPAHDFNDYAIGQRHQLPLINIFTIDAAVNENGPEDYRGLDRYDARKRIVAALQAQDLMEMIEPYKLMVPRGDRSHAVVEPYLTDQWYVKIQPLADPAIAAVETGAIRFVPENWSRTYFDWMHNIRDWCISRQLWWGHRIPAWYDPEGNIYVGRNEEEIRKKYSIDKELVLEQDPDVLDTWFSSALWPFSTLGWPEETPELKTYYPTSVLVTGFDIIFFWVARMIMMGLKFMDNVPFKDVYITGLIRDSEGRKMSKSKGNILDPVDLIDGIELEDLIKNRTAGMMQPQLATRIEKATRRHFPEGISAYGTDALRFTFAALASTGRDINFDIGRIQGYRNFCNKIWNAARYVIMNLGSSNIDINNGERVIGLPDRWIQTRLAGTIEQISECITGYRFDMASQAIYEFTWDEYCDWYLELSKVVLNDEMASEAEKRGTLHSLTHVMEVLLRMMHPFIPFITEEIWQRLAPTLNIDGSTIMLRSYPDPEELERDPTAINEIEWIKLFILGVRRIRAERDIAPGKALSLSVMAGNDRERSWLDSSMKYIKTLARVDSINSTEEVPENAVVALAGDMTLFVPLSDLINIEEESARLVREIERLTNEKVRICSKLNNSNFLERAPREIVDKERNKLAETEAALEKLQAQHDRIRSLISQAD